jgi:hypothetical protein
VSTQGPYSGQYFGDYFGDYLGASTGVTPGWMVGAAKMSFSASGTMTVVAQATTIGGGGRRAKERQHIKLGDETALRALVDAKWEAIETARLIDAAAQAARSATAAALSQSAAAAQAPTAAPATPVAVARVAAAAAPLPDAAQRARDARRLEDEDALILLLLES